MGKREKKKTLSLQGRDPRVQIDHRGRRSQMVQKRECYI